MGKQTKTNSPKKQTKQKVDFYTQLLNSGALYLDRNDVPGMSPTTSQTINDDRKVERDVKKRQTKAYYDSDEYKAKQSQENYKPSNAEYKSDDRTEVVRAYDEYNTKMADIHRNNSAYYQTFNSVMGMPVPYGNYVNPEFEYSLAHQNAENVVNAVGAGLGGDKVLKPIVAYMALDQAGRAFGDHSKTTTDYIAEGLQNAGLREDLSEYATMALPMLFMHRANPQRLGLSEAARAEAARMVEAKMKGTTPKSLKTSSSNFGLSKSNKGQQRLKEAIENVSGENKTTFLLNKDNEVYKQFIDNLDFDTKTKKWVLKRGTNLGKAKKVGGTKKEYYIDENGNRIPFENVVTNAEKTQDRPGSFMVTTENRWGLPIEVTDITYMDRQGRWQRVEPFEFADKVLGGNSSKKFQRTFDPNKNILTTQEKIPLWLQMPTTPASSIRRLRGKEPRIGHKIIDFVPRGIGLSIGVQDLIGDYNMYQTAKKELPEGEADKYLRKGIIDVLKLGSSIPGGWSNALNYSKWDSYWRMVNSYNLGQGIYDYFDRTSKRNELENQKYNSALEQSWKSDANYDYVDNEYWSSVFEDTYNVNK